jgi:hypothetical protein
MKEENMRAYRHGDLALIETDTLPGGLKKSTSKTLMTGSGGHHHTFDKGTFYPQKNGLVIGYLVAGKNAHLYHPEHGGVVEGEALRKASIPAGIYELRKQQEDTNDGLRPVVD